ncbi:MAG: WD40/YVTN/BNR-like repeat-containing protein [Candidatus Rokuibacteriota bacterium]
MTATTGATQHGPYRSTDHGEHWEKLNVKDHGLPVWSLLFDPCDADVLYASYENCEIYRSDDGGEHWTNMSHGQYLNHDTVDMHGVLVGRWWSWRLAARRLFCSADQGEHWASARLEPLNAKGQTYCRDIREAPGDPKTIWVAAVRIFRPIAVRAGPRVPSPKAPRRYTRWRVPDRGQRREAGPSSSSRRARVFSLSW